MRFASRHCVESVGHCAECEDSALMARHGRPRCKRAVIRIDFTCFSHDIYARVLRFWRMAAAVSVVGARFYACL